MTKVWPVFMLWSARYSYPLKMSSRQSTQSAVVHPKSDPQKAFASPVRNPHCGTVMSNTPTPLCWVRVQPPTMGHVWPDWPLIASLPETMLSMDASRCTMGDGTGVEPGGGASQSYPSGRAT